MPAPAREVAPAVGCGAVSSAFRLRNRARASSRFTSSVGAGITVGGGPGRTTERQAVWFTGPIGERSEGSPGRIDSRQVAQTGSGWAPSAAIMASSIEGAGATAAVAMVISSR